MYACMHVCIVCMLYVCNYKGRFDRSRYWISVQLIDCCFFEDLR